MECLFFSLAFPLTLFFPYTLRFEMRVPVLPNFFPPITSPPLGNLNAFYFPPQRLNLPFIFPSLQRKPPSIGDFLVLPRLPLVNLPYLLHYNHHLNSERRHDFLHPAFHGFTLLPPPSECQRYFVLPKTFSLGNVPRPFDHKRNRLFYLPTSFPVTPNFRPFPLP